MLRIGVMVSGGGTNLQAILDNINNGTLSGCQVVTVVSSKPDAFALERAKINNIPSKVISRKDFNSIEEYDDALLTHMQSCGAELVVLAGFLSHLGEKFVNAYKCNYKRTSFINSVILRKRLLWAYSSYKA